MPWQIISLNTLPEKPVNLWKPKEYFPFRTLRPNICVSLVSPRINWQAATATPMECQWYLAWCSCSLSCSCSGSSLLHQYQSEANERERPTECSFWVTAGSACLCQGDSGLCFRSVWCIGPNRIPNPPSHTHTQSQSCVVTTTTTAELAKTAASAALDY